jgi:type II secretory pathway pseudopilin PulG
MNNTTKPLLAPAGMQTAIPRGGDAAADELPPLWAAFGLLLFGLRRRGAEKRLPPSARGARGPRGYLLIEVMVSGAILAVLLTATVGVIATARSEISRGSFRAVATELAQQRLQMMLSSAPNALCPASDVPRPGFIRTCVISNATFATINLPFVSPSSGFTIGPASIEGVQRITVTVEYNAVGKDARRTITVHGFRRPRTL